MAKIVTPYLVFDVPEGVVSVRIRGADDYDAVHQSFPVQGEGEMRIAVPAILAIPDDAESATIYITTVEASGNESDFVEVSGPFDLTPPLPVANARFVQGS